MWPDIYFDFTPNFLSPTVQSITVNGTPSILSLISENWTVFFFLPLLHQPLTKLHELNFRNSPQICPLFCVSTTPIQATITFYLNYLFPYSSPLLHSCLTWIHHQQNAKTIFNIMSPYGLKPFDGVSLHFWKTWASAQSALLLLCCHLISRSPSSPMF